MTKVRRRKLLPGVVVLRYAYGGWLWAYIDNQPVRDDSWDEFWIEVVW